MEIILIEEVDSTNNYVASHAAALKAPSMVVARRQTAGRGQRGNTWESEPGKNLTFTVFCKPENIHPREQFAISEAVALAMTDVLRKEGFEAEVKWPNDIYVGDCKIAGILIEHSVNSEAIEHSRIGVGLNVNQATFVSDAPNPVSMKQLSGRDFDLAALSRVVSVAIESRLNSISDPSGRERVHNEFKKKLWRRNGAHAFREKDSDRIFEGEIAGIDPSGPIEILDIRNNIRKRYAFKEIEFVL